MFRRPRLRKSIGLGLVAALFIAALALLPGKGLVIADAVAAQPTEEEVKAAVADGVEWLAAQQSPDGSWGDWEECGVTALAVKKLEHHAVDPKWGLGLPSPFDPAYPYKANVEEGLAWLFENCVFTEDIGPQPAGDPDSDGDGIGVYWATSGDMHHSIYTTGIGLTAVCEAVELDTVVQGGPLAGQTYEDVARDTMDYLAWGQNDGGSERGGWGYEANDVGWSDNSITGWATLGLSFAKAAPPEGCGFTIPQFVLDELNIWIDFIQNDVDGGPNDGGSGYTDPDDWVNILKTGNLLQQMALVGDTETVARVQDALDYMARHWDDPNSDPGWSGGTGTASYQATFTAMKGFTSLGIHEFSDPPIDWQADFETELLAEQLPDGSWPGCEWGDPTLCTTWALLTLQKAAPEIVEPTPTPTPSPEPTPTPTPTPTAVAEVVELPTTGGAPSDGGSSALPWLAAIAGAIAVTTAGGFWFAYQRRRVR